jgi:hypothetical protein
VIDFAGVDAGARKFIVAPAATKATNRKAISNCRPSGEHPSLRDSDEAPGTTIRSAYAKKLAIAERSSLSFSNNYSDFKRLRMAPFLHWRSPVQKATDDIKNPD